MLGYTNKCPKCGKDSHFVPEEAECDKSLLLWCKHCIDYISLTFTIETFNKWWNRFDVGEDELKPPISKLLLLKLTALQTEIETDPDCYLDKVEIHLKDFTEYLYTEDTLPIKSDLKKFEVVFYNRFSCETETFRVMAKDEEDAERLFWLNHSKESYKDCIEHVREAIEFKYFIEGKGDIDHDVSSIS